MNPHITTSTPADPRTQSSHRRRPFGIGSCLRHGRILARRRKRPTRVFDGPSRRHAELDRGSGERGWSSRQAASSKAGPAEANPRQNEAVMSPRVRQQIRLIAGVWLAWTIAGLFYITQDSVPRLYRGQSRGLEVRVRRLDGGHVRLRRAHAGAPVARQPVAGRAARPLRGIASLLQRCLLDPGDGDRSPAAAAARRLPGRDAASVDCRGRQSDAVVRHSGRCHPVLGRDRAPGRVPVAEERQDSRAGGIRAEGAGIRARAATRNGAAERPQDAAAAALSLQHARRHHRLDPAAENGAGRSDGREARRSPSSHARRRGGAGSAAVARAGIPAAVPLDRAGPVRGPAEGAHRAGSRAVRHPRAAHGAAADRRERRPPWPRSERGSGDDRSGGDQRERLARARRVGRRAGASVAHAWSLRNRADEHEDPPGAAVRR